MPRTITVKGTGTASASPDLTVVTMTLKTVDKEYDASLSKSAEMLEGLQNALKNIGFEKSDLKTSSFNVYTERESVCDERGNYRSVFAGYACVNSLRLEFGFDTSLLSKVLSAISGCIADPELNISFTVKDKNALYEELLKNASFDAAKKASVLASASGVKLGKLLSINYDFSSVSFASPTSYACDNECMGKSRAVYVDIAPEDVTAKESITFVWEMSE